jgi:hypothetical protein
MKTIKVKHLFIAIIFLILMTTMNLCSVRQTKTSCKKLIKEHELLQLNITNLQTELFEVKKNSISNVDLQIQGLNQTDP